MKRILLLSISMICIISCDKLDDTPKCDDKEVINLTLQTFNENRRYYQQELSESSVGGIITLGKNRDIKSCDCEMSLKTLQVDRDYGKTLHYTAQKNSEGNLVIRTRYSY